MLFRAHRGDRPGKRVSLLYKFALKYCGTGGRTRTDTLSPEPDFESGASTIPPHPHLLSIRLNPSKSQGHRRLTMRGSSGGERGRSEEHTSELQSLMRISYAVCCLKKQRHAQITHIHKPILSKVKHA